MQVSDMTQYKQRTRPRSVRFVNITMTETFCSQIIRQKSSIVLFNGPCVAMYSCLL